MNARRSVVAFARALRQPRGIAGLVVGALLFAVGFLPLFDGPGYEFSIAAGLCVPIASAVVAAIEGFDGPRAVCSRSPLAAVARGLVTGALLSAVALATSFLHVLRAGACDPLGGIATYLLTAFAGALLGGAAGATASIAIAHILSAQRARRRYAIALAIAAPLTTIFVALSLFYFTPAVFAFDPYVGFFSGTLYDEVVDAYAPLLTYRAGTCLTLGAILLGASALRRDGEGRLSLRDVRLAAVAGLLAIGSLTLVWLGPELGHRTSSAWVKESLGGHREGPRCDAWFPLNTADVDAALLLRDCEEEIASVEKRLGVAGPERITAFFFRDSAQKRALIGAADTYVAKPWRREVYLQVSTYPHPVLGHELAHVIAGSFGRGPFSIAGTLDAILPNPGLVEGVAVAASPDRDELTPAQWAHAMKMLDLLPPLGSIFGGGFLAQNSSTAYTVAGAFIGFLFDTGRAEQVRAWYGGRSFPDAFGRAFDDVEAEWRTSLDAVSLPPEALAVAKARFERPAIWGRVCPHVVERLREEADQCHDRGDYDGADAHLQRLLRLDVADPGARMDLAKYAGEEGDRARMIAALAAIVDDPRMSTTWRDRAREAIGDEALRHGELDEARKQYDLARAEVLDDDWARGFDVKSFVASTPKRAALFGRLLVGREGHHDESTAGQIAIARFLERGDGDEAELALARYLLARRLYDARSYDDAEALLAPPGIAPLSTISPRLLREAARLHLAMACLAPAPERASRVAEALERYRAAPQGNIGRREAQERFAARCVGGG